MDIKQALRSIFLGPNRQLSSLSKAGLIACVPIIGQMVLAAHALQFVRAAALNDDRKFTELRLDVQTLFIGFKCQLLTIVATIAAGLLTLPLWALDQPVSETDPDVYTPTTALLDALQSPTALVTAVLAALFSALCLARFATTGSALSALDVAGTWSHLRAQTSLWISVAAVGFLLVQAPTTIALLLPLSTDDTLLALLIASAFFLPVALYIQAHLIGQAFNASAGTIARRRPLVVRVRW